MSDEEEKYNQIIEFFEKYGLYHSDYRGHYFIRYSVPGTDFALRVRTHKDCLGEDDRVTVSFLLMSGYTETDIGMEYFFDYLREHNLELLKEFIYNMDLFL